MPRKKLTTLTEQMYYVLLVLDNERCGSEIVSAVQNLTKNRIKLGAGTLYTILSLFEEEEIIQETKILGRKRMYQITSHGRSLLNQEIRRLKQMLIDTQHYKEE